MEKYSRYDAAHTNQSPSKYILTLHVCLFYIALQFQMLGTRGNFPGRMQESLRPRGAGIRRRHGSLSSLPSSSISGRPIRDRRRIDERRKIKDVKVY